MSLPDLSDIEGNGDSIVEAIGREAVDVYGFLADEFGRRSAVGNYVFQFTYRSFYRLDNAGLTPGGGSTLRCWKSHATCGKSISGHWWRSSTRSAIAEGATKLAVLVCDKTRQYLQPSVSNLRWRSRKSIRISRARQLRDVRRSPRKIHDFLRHSARHLLRNPRWEPASGTASDLPPDLRSTS